MTFDDQIRSPYTAIRLNAAYSRHIPDQSQLEICLRDPASSVRVRWSERTDYPVNKDILDIVLSDKYYSVAERWALRTDWTPSKEQVISFFGNKHVSVLYAGRRDYPVDNDIIEAALSNSRSCIIWLERDDWTPTPEQVADGLRSTDIDIVLAWLNRDDWTPAEEQISMGLSSNDPDIREAWMHKALLSTMNSLDCGEQYAQQQI